MQKRGIESGEKYSRVAVSWRGLSALRGVGVRPTDAEHPEIAAIACFASRFPGCGRRDAGPGPRGQRRDLQPDTRSPAPAASVPRCRSARAGVRGQPGAGGGVRADRAGQLHRVARPRGCVRADRGFPPRRLQRVAENERGAGGGIPGRTRILANARHRTGPRPRVRQRRRPAGSRRRRSAKQRLLASSIRGRFGHRRQVDRR